MSRTPILLTCGIAAAAVATALLLGSGPGGSASVDPEVPPVATSSATHDSPGGGTGHTSGPGSPSSSSSSSSGTSDPASPPTSASGTPDASSSSGPFAAQPSEWGIESQPDSEQPGPVESTRRPGHTRPPEGALLRAAPHSVVSEHSRSRSGRAVQVAITASKRAQADAVLFYYRTHLGRFGFRETHVPAAGGSTAAGFRDGRDSVVVTVTPRSGGGVTYSVFGVIRSGAA